LPLADEPAAAAVIHIGRDLCFAPVAIGPFAVFKINGAKDLVGEPLRTEQGEIKQRDGAVAVQVIVGTDRGGRRGGRTCGQK